jgi:hypothetical protein
MAAQASWEKASPAYIEQLIQWDRAIFLDKEIGQQIGSQSKNV